MPTSPGEPSDSPVQQDMTPEPAAEVIVVEAAMDATSAMGGHVDPPGGPDLSREGPYDVYDLPPVLGTAPVGSGQPTGLSVLNDNI